MGSVRVLRGAVLGMVLVAMPPTAAYAGDAVEAPARPDARAWNLALFAGAGDLGSPGAQGAAFLGGLRLGAGSHFAGTFDVGYGLLSAAGATAVQDRWWAIPSAALVLPAGAVRFDLGAGAGVGTSSGYLAWSDYAARPFTPVWHYTVPAVRAHVAAAVAVTRGLELFARADVATLLFAGSDAATMDTTWLALWIGVQPRLL